MSSNGIIEPEAQHGEWEIPSGSSVHSDEELEFTQSSAAPSDLGDEPWESMYGDEDTVDQLTAHSNVTSSAQDVATGARAPLPPSDGPKATSNKPMDRTLNNDQIPALPSLTSSMDLSAMTDSNTASTFSFSFPDPLTTSSHDDLHLSLPPPVAAHESSEGTISDLDSDLLREPLLSADSPLATTLKSETTETPTAKRRTSFGSSVFCAALTIATVLVGCVMHSWQPNIPSLFESSRSTPNLRWEEISPSSIATAKPISENLATNLYTSTVSPVHVPTRVSLTPSPTQAATNTEKGRKWLPTIQAAEKPLLLESTLSVTSSTRGGFFLGNFGGGFSSTPLPSTPPPEATAVKSLSPFSAFTASLSISMESFSRVLLRDLQDVIAAIDELFQIIRTMASTTAESSIAVAVKQYTSQCIDYIDEKTGFNIKERNARAIENVNKIGRTLLNRNKIAYRNVQALGLTVRSKFEELKREAEGFTLQNFVTKKEDSLDSVV